MWYNLLISGILAIMVSSSNHSLPDFDSLWNYDKPAETERNFRELLPQAKDSGDSGYQAELLSQIARSLGLQRRFAAADSVLDEVLKMLPQAGKEARVRYLLERGRVRNSSGEPGKARPFFEEALEVSRKGAPDNHAVDAAHMLAIVDSGQAALDWNIKALAMAENSSQPKARKWLGSLYNNIGWTYFDMQKYESALTLFQKALAFRQEQGKVAPIRIAKWSVARAKRFLGQVDEALAVQRELEKEWAQSGEEQDGYVFEELAECLLIKNDPNATNYFALAYKYLSQDVWLSENETGRLKRLKELGKVE